MCRTSRNIDLIHKSLSGTDEVRNIDFLMSAFGRNI